ncbi:MAG TPA: DUF3857 domain-containing protein [Panacibacter sp.]|nr:DUF3857 domain-containing protein [Panacibacter sp.]
MQKRPILIVFFLLIVIEINAQSPKFGQADVAELQMKECPFEKDAAAMFLVNEVTATVTVDSYNGDVKIEYEHRVRIKIFNENGYKYASIVIPYFANKRLTRITDIDAVMYQLDESGKPVTKNIDKDEIFKDKAEGKKGYNSIRFTYSGLKPGAVVEYRYTKTRKGSSYLEPWLFQDQIPTQTSLCTILAPKEVKINTHFVTLQQAIEDSVAREREASKRELRRYIMYNVPSFRIEPLMSSVKDNLQRVEFSLAPARSFFGILESNAETRWSFYNMALLRSPFFGGQFNTIIPGTEQAADSIKKLTANTDKINAVFELVKQNVKWDKEQTLYADDIKEVWKNKSGNSAELNIIIINLLRKTGIICYPLLISTRQNGKTDETFPNMAQFNGVDVLVADSIDFYILDGTQQYQNFKAPPFNILNRSAYVVDDTQNRWVTIEDSRPLMSSSITVDGKIDSSGILSAEAVMIYKDFAKTERMKDEDESDDEEKDQEKDFLKEDQTDLKIDTLIKENANNSNEPLIHNVKFHYTLANTENIYFLNPFLFSMFRKNPFTDSTRYSDIDFGCNQYYATNMHILVPSNFTVEEVPASKTIRMSDSSIVFKRSIFSTFDGIVIRNTFELNYYMFAKEEYPAVKEFFKKIYALINEQIVLKRKED